MKFKNNLWIEGSEAELLPIRIGLKNLGYQELPESGREAIKSYSTGGFWLCLNNHTHVGCSDPVIVSADNPELVLALAAMIDDDKPHVGEWVKGDYDSVIGSGLHKITETDGENYNVDGAYKGGDVYQTDLSFDKKATVEEIMRHFESNNKVEHLKQNNMKKYKFKEGCEQYREAAETITGMVPGGRISIEGFLEMGGAFKTKLKEAGVLDLWFEEVKEEKFKVKVGDYVALKEGSSNSSANYSDKEGTVRKVTDVDVTFGIGTNGVRVEGIGIGGWGYKDIRLATPEEIAKAQKKTVVLRCEGGSFEVEVSKEGIFYAPESYFLDIEDIRGLADTIRVNTRTPKGSTGAPYTFKTVTVDSGCKKKVPIEDWKKVIDTYDKLDEKAPTTPDYPF